MTLIWGVPCETSTDGEAFTKDGNLCSCLQVLHTDHTSGPFLTNKPKVAFLSWDDLGFSACGPSCVPDEKVNLLAQTALVNATSPEKHRYLPPTKQVKKGNVAITTDELWGERNACCSFHWPFNWQILREQWLHQLLYFLNSCWRIHSESFICPSSYHGPLTWHHHRVPL